MSTVDELFARYRAAARDGRPPDPGPYIDEVRGVDRRELVALIDHYLAEHAPRPRFDRAALEGDALAQRVLASVAALEPRESWATLLPRARDAARLPRTALVRALAGELGVAAQERKVGDYYHEMEIGRLAPEGVSERVLEALSGIVGVPLERLRAAGRNAMGASGGPMPVFARTAPLLADLDVSLASVDADADADAHTGAGEPWDVVDELFRGGDLDREDAP